MGAAQTKTTEMVVKLFIEEESSQELIFKGCLLRDAAKLSDCGIKDKSSTSQFTIHLETQPVTKTLFIKDNHGQTNTFFLDEEFKSYTVLQLKTKIREKLTTRESSQELFFKGCLLRDAAELSVYGILHKSTIHLETQDQQRLIFGGKQLEESVTMFWEGPVEGTGGMGDKGGKNRSMETVLHL